MHKDDTIEAVLATIGTVPKPPPKGKERKLEKLKVGTPEFSYMLATYCFDLQRKLLYLCQVAHPFDKFMPEGLAKQIQADTRDINKGRTWEERAREAEQVMLRLYGEVEPRPQPVG